jgi:putative ABC transport system permease protein
MRSIWARVKRLWNRLSNRDAEWREEIDAHLAMSEEWHQARGSSADESRVLARKQFGSELGAAEQVRAIHIHPWIDTAAQDLRFALRGFRKSSGFTLVVCITLGLGVGVSTVVYSVVDPLLFRRLPYPNDHQLVSLGYFGPIDNNEFNVVSSYLDWRAHQKAFQSMTSMRPAEHCDVLAGDAPLRVDCDRVEANFLGTLGVTPLLGRDFTEDEDRPGSPPAALLSFGLWQRAFGGSDRVLGQTVQVDDQPTRVVGVLPESFEMPQLGDVDLIMPERLNASLPRPQNSSSFLRTFARLGNGFSVDRARAEMQALFDETARLDVPPQLRSEVRLIVRSLRDRRIQDVKLASWMLLGAVMALLLASCANVANLLLARAAARRPELAMRAALGASRSRLVRQSLTESLALGLIGCLVGCVLSWVLLRILVHWAPEGLFRLQQARIDARSLLFALAAAACTALLFGAGPALQRPPSDALGGRGTCAPARTLFRRILVMAQIAISLVLLTGASLFVRSLSRLESQPLGFDSEHLVTASLAPPTRHYPSAAARMTFFNELEARLSQIPGTGVFALSDSMPPQGIARSRPYSNLRLKGHPPVAQNGGMVLFRWVTPSYFEAMHIPILAGRTFFEDERVSGESPLILSASLARRLFGNESPIGQYLDLDANGHECPVVGIAADVKNQGLAELPSLEYYRLRMKTIAPPDLNTIAIYRTSLNSATLARWIHEGVRSLDPVLPVTIETMDQRVGRLRQQPRFVAMLVTLFAGLSLLLAAVGLYGVLTFLISQQTREIGVRIAIGARPRDIAAEVQKNALIWTMLGIAAGIAGSLALAGTVRGLVFGISPYDPRSLVIAAALLIMVATLAALVPAWRSARVDPIFALRHE